MWRVCGRLNESPRVKSVAQKRGAFAESTHDAVFVATCGKDGKDIAGHLSAHILELFHVYSKPGRIASVVAAASMRGEPIDKAFISTAHGISAMATASA